MITICLIPNFSPYYRICNLEHSSRTFELLTLVVVSEENGHCVHMVYSTVNVHDGPAVVAQPPNFSSTTGQLCAL